MRLLIALTLFSVTSFASKQVEIRKFRFNRHSSANFERLVLEFGSKDSTSPEVKIAPTANGKEMTVTVESTALVGSIPESDINESYTPKSHWIGPISINSDSPKGGFSVRTFLKNPGAQVDAFWLESPSRLIVDVFPKDSLRASVGREVLSMQAAKSKPVVQRKIASVEPKPKKDGSVVCFPVTAEVKAKIGYQKYQGSNQVGMKVDADEKLAENTDSIVCYPSTARVNPTVTFYSNELRATKMAPAVSHSTSSPNNAATAQVHSLAPAPKADEHKADFVPMTDEERLNKEADLALGFPEPKKELAKPAIPVEKRQVASEGMLVPFQDNFNKNNPPPTLGKRLLPPGSFTPGNAKAPQLANPKGLLPPVK